MPGDSDVHYYDYYLSACYPTQNWFPGSPSRRRKFIYRGLWRGMRLSLSGNRSARFVPSAWCLQMRQICLPAEKEWQEIRVSSTAAKEVYLCILSHRFYLQVKLTSELVMSLLACSRVKRHCKDSVSGSGVELKAFFHR